VSRFKNPPHFRREIVRFAPKMPRSFPDRFRHCGEGRLELLEADAIAGVARLAVRPNSSEVERQVGTDRQSSGMSAKHLELGPIVTGCLESK